MVQHRGDEFVFRPQQQQAEPVVPEEESAYPPGKPFTPWSYRDLSTEGSASIKSNQAREEAIDASLQDLSYQEAKLASMLPRLQTLNRFSGGFLAPFVQKYETMLTHLQESKHSLETEKSSMMFISTAKRMPPPKQRPQDHPQDRPQAPPSNP